MTKKKQWGHVGVVRGFKFLKSPCHKVGPIEIRLPVDKDGTGNLKYVCSLCLIPYSAIELDIIDSNYSSTQSKESDVC